MSELNLGPLRANRKIYRLMHSMRNCYGIEINKNKHIANGLGGVADGIDGDLSIDIGFNPRTERDGLLTKVNDYDFIDAIRALYHEEQHLIQSCWLYQDKNPSEDVILMATHKLATQNNRKYYINTYRTDLAEIDAEGTAIFKAYGYLKTEFPDVDAERLICNLINDKASDGPGYKSCYFIKGHFDSIGNIMNAFSNQFERAKNAQVSIMR